MGMYDTFGSSGDQLKIFPVACFYYDEDNTKGKMLGYIGGMLNHYSLGDEVPWKEMAYKYAKDFVVVDADPFSPILFVFKNGRLHEIYEDFLDTDVRIDADFANILILDRYGNRLQNINSAMELKEYTRKQIEFDKEHTKTMRDYAAKFREIQKKMRDYSDQDLVREYISKAKALHNELDEIQRNLFKKYNLDTYETKEDRRYTALKTYGAYLDLALFHKNKKEEKLNEALKKEAGKFLKLTVLTLDDFLIWNETDEEQKARIAEADKWLRSTT